MPLFAISGSVNQFVASVFRLLIQGLFRKAGRGICIKLTGGNTLENSPHYSDRLAIVCELGLEGMVNRLVDRLDFLLSGAGIRRCVVDGFQTGSGDGDVAFSVGVVFVHSWSSAKPGC